MGKILKSHFRRRLLAGCIAVALAVGSSGAAFAASYPTAEAAMAAFGEALGKPEGLATLFGPEHRAELIGGDPAQARINLELLQRAASEGMQLAPEGDGSATIVMGRAGWPMPIPLVKGTDGWQFDTTAGIEEIVDRRIGRNELSAIQLAMAYVDAQRTYASEDRDDDQVLEYAQRLVSTPGSRDGLYWEPTSPDDLSPFGPFAAAAESYLAERREGEPYRGYHARILTKQGATPPGGAYDYVINGNMIAGYALLLWPAEYDNSGVMSFMVSHQGHLFQRDLGKDTAKAAAAITTYDPGEGWEEVVDLP